MAQKTNPLAFRLGTTQSHHSVWFEEPKNYSAALQEDQQIRHFFQNYVQKRIKEHVALLHKIYNKKQQEKEKYRQNKKNDSFQKKRNWQKKKNSEITPLGFEGIVRIEIQKKRIHTKRTSIEGLQIQKAFIEIIVYSGYIPKFLFKRKKDFEKIIEKQEFCYLYPKKIRIEFKKVKQCYSQPNLLAEFIAFKIKEKIPYRKIMHEALNLAQKNMNTIKGIKIQMAGRIDGKDIARKLGKRIGKLPLQTMFAKIDYCSHKIKTINGILGVKIWIFRK